MVEILALVGGITTHPLDPSKTSSKYKNTIASNGTIVNPYSAVLAGNNKYKTGVLYGVDSLGGSIIGSISYISLHQNIGIVVGGYNYNKDLFESKGVVPPNIAGITPVIGFDFNFNIYKSRAFSIESHNIISTITTHSLGVKFDI
jgi:hypothetical protein